MILYPIYLFFLGVSLQDFQALSFKNVTAANFTHLNE